MAELREVEAEVYAARGQLASRRAAVARNDAKIRGIITRIVANG